MEEPYFGSARYDPQYVCASHFIPCMLYMDFRFLSFFSFQSFLLSFTSFRSLFYSILFYSILFSLSSPPSVPTFFFCCGSSAQTDTNSSSSVNLPSGMLIGANSMGGQPPFLHSYNQSGFSLSGLNAHHGSASSATVAHPSPPYYSGVVLNPEVVAYNFLSDVEWWMPVAVHPSLPPSPV